MPAEEPSHQIEFKDIAKLSNRDVQTLLRAVDTKDLALALKGADEAVRDRIFENVSRRVAALLRDEMKLQAAAKFSDVREVRALITNTARQLQAAGDITWPPAASPAARTPDERAEARKPHVPAPAQKQMRRYIYGLVGALAGIVLLVVLTTWFGGENPSPPSEKKPSPRQAAAERAESEKSGPANRAAPSRETGENPSQTAEREPGAGGPSPPPAEETEHPAEEDQRLRPGEQVQTGETEQATMGLPGNTGRVQIESNSILLAPDSAPESGEPPRLEMRVGKVQVDVQDPRLEVTSPLANLTAAEGTQYNLQVVLDATTIISVQHGTVWVKLKVESDNEYQVLGPGETLRIEPGGKVTKGKWKETDQPGKR